MRNILVLVALILLGPISVQASAAEAQCPASALSFWKSFRQVVLKGDKQKVARYAIFPFEIRGVLDGTEKRKVNRDQFLKSYDVLTTADPGLSAEPSTMVALIKSTPNLPHAACSEAGNEFRVGTWAFEFMPQGWRFVRAYVD